MFDYLQLHFDLDIVSLTSLSNSIYSPFLSGLILILYSSLILCLRPHHKRPKIHFLDRPTDSPSNRYDTNCDTDVEQRNVASALEGLVRQFYVPQFFCTTLSVVERWATGNVLQFVQLCKTCAGCAFGKINVSVIFPLNLDKNDTSKVNQE